MESPFKNTGIVTRPNASEIQDTVHTLVSFLRENGFTIYPDELSVEEHCVYIQDLTYCETVNKARLGKYCDLVVVLDGDGTFPSAAREVAPRAVPIVGIDQGCSGFLTQISCDTMVEGIRLVLEGKYLPKKRILIGASTIRDGETIGHAPAPSDTVLSRNDAGQMIEFEIFIDREFVYTQRSDGPTISTSTDSAVYALAASGPIIQADLHALTLMPICPRSMANRPIVIPDTSVIEILTIKSGDVHVHSDGQSHIDMQNFDCIIIYRYHNPLRVFHPTDYQYFKVLRQKLHRDEQLV